jgi:hypothetical protein
MPEKTKYNSKEFRLNKYKAYQDGLRLLAVSGLTLSIFVQPQMATAAGSAGARRISENTLYRCSGIAYEILFEQGNAFDASNELTIVCLTSINQARWIIKANSECALSQPTNGLCKGNVGLSLESFVTYPTNASNFQPGTVIRHSYRFPKGILGEFCKLEPPIIPDLMDDAQEEKVWICEKHRNLGRTSVSTTGDNVLTYVGDFKEQEQDFRLEYPYSKIKELLSINQFQNSVNTVAGVKIVATESECSTSPRICESWLRVFIQNTTGQPQKYLVIKANIYDKQRNELTNDACFSGYEIIDIGKILLPNAKISVQTHFRKYFEYGTAQLGKVEWHGLRKPDANKVYPEVNYQCP